MSDSIAVAPGTVASSPSGIAGPGEASAEAARDRQKVAQLAAEFESMLLLQMLREMRAAGSWQDEQDEPGFGAEALFDTLDVELASHLAKTRGFGLGQALVPGLAPLVGRDAARPAAPPAIEMGAVPGLESLGWAAPAAADAAALAPGALPAAAPAVTADAHAVTSTFGWRRDPFTGAAAFHRGVDLRAAYGEPVHAAGPGRVVAAGEQGGYGQTVVVEHADGLRTRYAHLSAVLVAVGDQVETGASLGRAGRSGRATGTHLHFEVTKDGRAVDPAASGLLPLKPGAIAADLVSVADARATPRHGERDGDGPTGPRRAS